MRLALYEDGLSSNFGPIALMRPVFELVCGHFSLRERVIRSANVAEWGALVREHLVDVYREEHPECFVNDERWLARMPTLLINGRWLPPAGALDRIRTNEAGRIGDTITYITVDPLEAPLLADHNRDVTLARLAATRTIVAAPGRLIEHPWDLVEQNSGQLRSDFGSRRRSVRSACADTDSFGPHVALLGPRENIYVDAAATVEPFAVLDARNGPVWVEAGAKIGSFTQLEGPCYVGSRSQLLRAQVRAATTIGPECRVGGEVENSILHGCVNKYHLGFFGHAYACPWVNLGALATNSDLKSDYSDVLVPLWGEPVDSGLMKVGCFIGDHTKIAIGSLFNTGSSIGVMSLILPGGELLPKHVPSFSRVWHGELSAEGDLEVGIRTARAALERRNQELTPAHERLIRHLHAVTRTEREAAVARVREKRRPSAELLQ